VENLQFSKVHDDGRAAICRLFTKFYAVGKMADRENMLERDAERSNLRIPPPFPCRWAFGAPRG